jgi:hypothetical protein
MAIATSLHEARSNRQTGKITTLVAWPLGLVRLLRSKKMHTTTTRTDRMIFIGGWNDNQENYLVPAADPADRLFLALIQV